MILPVRRGGLDNQQRKYPFARRKKYLAKKRSRKDQDLFAAWREEKKECLAKKGSRQGRKKSLCAFPTLRLCVNKKRISPRPPRRTGLAGFAPSREKNRSRKKGRRQNQDSFASLRPCVNLLFIKKSIGDTVEIA